MAKLACGVRRRKNGCLEKRFSLEGKRYSVYGWTLRQLNQKEQALRVRLGRGSQGEKLPRDNNQQQVTLADYYETWIDRKRLTVRPNTIGCYNSFFRPRILPLLGDKPLCNLVRADGFFLQQQLAGQVSPCTCNNAITVLKLVLNDAVRDGLLCSNPLLQLPQLSSKRVMAEVRHRALSEDEQRTFMGAARESRYYALFALMLLTGLRLGEATALTWDDIDWDKRIMRIRRTMTRSEQGAWHLGTTTKSQAGVRDIPLTPVIVRILRDWGKAGASWQGGMNVDVMAKTGLVFATPKGKIVTNGTVNREIGRICKWLEEQGRPLERFTSHALRDTFATRYIEQGGNPQTLKTLLGHTSLSMTMDLYCHVMPETRRREMEQLDFGLEIS